MKNKLDCDIFDDEVEMLKISLQNPAILVKPEVQLKKNFERENSHVGETTPQRAYGPMEVKTKDLMMFREGLKKIEDLQAIVAKHESRFEAMKYKELKEKVE